MFFRLWIFAIVFMLSACGATGPTNGSAQPENLMQIDSVDIQIAESTPVQVSTRLQGTLADGCTSLSTISQERTENTINIILTAEHSGDEACIMVAPMIDETVVLEGEFPPGEYIVRVGDIEQTFNV
ncbi:MAG: hypothetical protein GFH27_549301n251 [Chloroflexi bacterium AL-W]|nr:hypothetical protein [Chloroflexi bacterium AL-N1]NOK68445.1 hypothetical protein [Chloroflexi bacterium AL-N10]NOK74091.1 hypothetical protein [Chloroflexi bacterium AL-N5]NOK83058.1 hypothetical protein [Chloroflexi bacterium AL-W]NOK90581.1 hypothetical protein [Chloroflexi bacterium AL-N15]